MIICFVSNVLFDNFRGCNTTMGRIQWGRNYEKSNIGSFNSEWTDILKFKIQLGSTPIKQPPFQKCRSEGTGCIAEAETIERLLSELWLLSA